MSADRLLDAAEVAEMLHVPTSWVYAAARNGTLPSVALGRYVRFDAAEIARWLSARKTTSQ